MTAMTPEQHRAYALDLLTEHADAFEYLSISEAAEESEHVPGDTISEADMLAVDKLIRAATVTITWPAP